MTLLYICRNHPGLGEMWAGQGSAEQIKASGCRLCEIEQLRLALGELVNVCSCQQGTIHMSRYEKLLKDSSDNSLTS